MDLADFAEWYTEKVKAIHPLTKDVIYRIATEYYTD